MTTDTKRLRHRFRLGLIISGLWRKLTGKSRQQELTAPLNDHLRNDLGLQDQPQQTRDYRDYL